MDFSVKQRSLKKRSISASLLCATMALNLLFVGCARDDSSTKRIIKKAVDNNKETKTSIVLDSPVAVSEQRIDLYDLTNKKQLGNTAFKTAKKPKIANAPTKIEKGLTAKLDIEKSSIDTSALMLATYSIKAGQSYFDPIRNQNITLTQDKSLYALTLGSRLSVRATPFTTLALYRSLARTGWFFDHDKLPTNKQLNKYITTDAATHLFTYYNAALAELLNTFGFNSFDSSIEKLTDLKPLRDDSNTTSKELARVSGWINTLAQLRIYDDKFNAAAPYYDFAHDLAYDFLDGDIDGLGIATTKITASKKMVDALVNTDPKSNFIILQPKNSNKSVVTNGGIYDIQRSVLVDYEAAYLSKMQDVIADTGITDTSLIKNLLKPLNTTDKSLSKPQQMLQANQTDALTYSDFRPGSTSELIYHQFAGVGNKTLAFGLSDNSLTKNFIGAAPLSLTKGPYSGIASLVGRYTSATCTLTILPDGVFTLTQKGAGTTNTTQTAILDRTLNDNISRASKDSASYKLNVFSKESTPSLSRVIQITIDDGRVAAAASQVTPQAGVSALPAPDMSCRF